MAKRTVKTPLSVFLALLLLVCSAPLYGFTLLPAATAADPLTSGIFTYTLNTAGTEATITKCDASAFGTVTVPDAVDGIPVKTIGSYAFVDAVNITEIVLPESLKSISQYALANANLRTVNVPSQVTYFQVIAFSKSPKLENINVAPSNTALTSIDGIVYNKNVTMLTYYPQGKTDKILTIRAGVTSVGMQAISENPYLESIVFQEGFKSLSRDAIQYCSKLAEITLPASFETYGNASSSYNPPSIAINNCSELVACSVPAENAYFTTVDGVLYNKAVTKLIRYPAGKADTSFTVPSTVTEIDFAAFENADKLVTVNVPDNVTKYNNSYFYGCDMLENANLGNGGKMLPVYMFAGCTAMKSFTVPDSITKIYENCFNGCTSLETVTLGASLVNFPTNNPYSAAAFVNTPSLTEFIVPASNAGYTAENGILYNKSKTALVRVPEGYEGDSFVVPDTVTVLGCFSLANTNISTVVIPETVNKICDAAFLDCNNLTSLTLPEAVSYIGYRAIESCDSLETLKIKGELTFLGASFANNTTVDEFEFTDSEEYMSVDGMVIDNSNGKLIKCVSDTKLMLCEIPDNVTKIAKNAFKDCNNIMTLIIPETVSTVESQAFNNNKCLTSISVPGASTRVYADSFGKWNYSVAVSDAEYLQLLNEKKSRLIELEELTERYELAKNAGHNTETIEAQIVDKKTEIKTCDVNIDNALTPETNLISYPTLRVAAPAGSTAAAASEKLEAELGEPTDEPCAHAVTHTVPAVPVSCVNDGYTEAVYCDVCFAKISGGEFVENATGHTFGEWESTATCTEAGVKTRTCSVCQYTESENVDALGHDFSDTFTQDTAPDCIHEGSRSRHCSRCDALADVTVIPVTGVHNFGEWEEILPDTATSDGTERRTCTVCGFWEDRPIPMGTHDRTNDWQIHTAASCTHPGLRRMYYGVGGAQYLEDVIPATGHSFGAWFTVYGASCSSEGLERRVCSVCGETEENSIPKTAHVDRDYNCICDNCGAAVNSVKPHGDNCFCYKYENNQFFAILCQIFSLVRDILDTIFI